MISILLKSSIFFIWAILLVVPGSLSAQESLALSVSPTLFEISAVPGQVWQSSVKVINSNPYPITVYANPVNFAPEGERGLGSLIPILESYSDGSTLAEWISIQEKTIEIPAEQSKEVSFVVSVPENAPPGGHFAAILIGTQPPAFGAGMQLRTSQIVSSLFFLRIEGDVVESGAIRSFSTDVTFSETPEAAFSLRFENKGNVHLQPRGSIEIYNMWGTERGVVPINQQTNFGNVLPNSIREYSFSWQGEQSLSDIGRYKAVASLAYGASSRQFSSNATYFWVLPIRAGVVTLLFVVLVIMFVRWSIKVYVRKMLHLAGVDDEYIPRRQRQPLSENDVTVSSYQQMSAPVRSGWLDFKNRVATASDLLARVQALGTFVVAYRLFFGALFAGIIIIAVLVWFIGDVRQDRSFTVEIAAVDAPVAFNSEEIALQDLVTPSFATASPTQNFALSLVNTSQENGTAAQLAKRLIDAGYEIGEISADVSRNDKRSVIVFSTDLEQVALELSEFLGGAIVSADSNATTSVVTIYTGADQIIR